MNGTNISPAGPAAGMKTEAIIQARMGSTRLPGKVMTDLCGRPVIWHVIERVRQSRFIDDVVVATPELKQDDVIRDYLAGIGIKCFRGSEVDVLSRYYHAAKRYPADAVVRITADCPLVDPEVIDKVISRFWESPCQYASNFGGARTFPRGLDCEIFTAGLLERAYGEATENYEREHVTPFMYQKQNSVAEVRNTADWSDMRWTLDTAEDFQLIQEVYRHFYKGRHDFYMRDIYAFLTQNPHVFALNREVKQKSIKE